MTQRAVPAVVMRGGTSRGVFFHRRDVPEDPTARDAFFLEVLGSPDPLQVDGLGGTFSSNSKVMVVAPGEGDGDIDYIFGQVAVDREHVDYVGNCGNLTAAVGAFAVDEGLVDAVEPVTVLHLRNLNTGVRVRVRVPVRDGQVVVQGEHVVSDVVRPGAEIETAYLAPAGSVLGSLLPTDAPIDALDVPGVGAVRCSIVDVTSPVVFVAATDLGLTASERPADVNADPRALHRVEAVRASAAVRVGLADDLEDVPFSSPSQPKLAICAGPGDDDATLVARIFSMGRMHHAFTVTGLLCTGAAVALPGTVPHALTAGPADPVVRISHPRGTAEVRVETSGGPGDITSVAIIRTARRIMRGQVYVRA